MKEHEIEGIIKENGGRDVPEEQTEERTDHENK